MSDERDERHEGWEGLAEEASEGSLDPSQELEQALREASDAVEERQAARTRGEGPGKATEELEAARAELEQTKDRLLRMAADFENFRRRTLKERQEAFQYGHQNLVKDLLPTVDNLERAIDHAREAGEGGESKGLLQGVELVLRELRQTLEKHGLSQIEADGKPFDPAVHEAMTQAVDGSVPANTVVGVFQQGYQLRDRLLRPARVAVSTPGEETESSGEGESEGS